MQKKLLMTFGTTLVYLTLSKITYVSILHSDSEYERKEKSEITVGKFYHTDPGGLSFRDVSLRPLACWDCGFESRRSMDFCLLAVLCVVR